MPQKSLILKISLLCFKRRLCFLAMNVFKKDLKDVLQCFSFQMVAPRRLAGILHLTSIVEDPL